MSRTDLTSDAFTIIRNALKNREEDVTIPFSNMMLKICDILKNEGYIENYKEMEGAIKKIKVYLRYNGKKPAITSIQKISTPGRRVYARRKDINSVLRGYGIKIVSTSHGLYTDRQVREKGLGGEVLGMVW
jgi:small subunit ribosomal protein S8